MNSRIFSPTPSPIILQIKNPLLYFCTISNFLLYTTSKTFFSDSLEIKYCQTIFYNRIKNRILILFFIAKNITHNISLYVSEMNILREKT